MSNGVTNYDEDDGFISEGSRPSRGGFLKWSADANPSWRDQDGCSPPPQMVAVFLNERLCRWQGGQPEYITEKPLPDPGELNSQIPQDQWERGLTGDLRPPWEHQVVVGLVDPASGQKFIYSAATVGAHIAVDELRESVVMMRLLRGVKVVPLVQFSSRPMKTKFKISSRPYLKIVDWKTLGGGGGVLPQPQPQPQLPASEAAPAESAAPKTKITTGAKTLKAMADVKPLTTAEIIDDDIPW
jgi:hypothetical protein